MSAKSLFNLVLKVLGIFFLKDIVLAIPAFLQVFYNVGEGDMSGAVIALIYSLLSLSVYGLIIYFLIFRTDLIINKLKLTENTPQDPIPLNIHRSTIISITIGIVALLLITQALPQLIRGLIKWYQYNRASRGVLNMVNAFDYSYIFIYISEIVIGLLMIGHQRFLTNFLEKKQRTFNGG